MKKDGCKPGEIRMGGKCVPRYCKDCININFVDPLFNDEGRSRFSGYILPDGKVIDAGSEHYNISKCMPTDDKPHPNTKRYLPMIIKNFMKKCHAIRYSIDYINHTTDSDTRKRILVETYYKPTNRQIDAIVQDMRENRGIGFIGDRTNLKGEHCDDVTCAYEKMDNAYPWDIQGFIKKCW